MWEFIRDVLTALFDHQETGESRHIYRWRQTVAVMIMTIGGIGGLHIAWACGWLTFFGAPGFATASEWQASQQTLKTIQMKQITNDIRNNKTDNCVAATEGNLAALRYSQGELSANLELFRSVTGYYPRIPGCDELIAASKSSVTNTTNNITNTTNNR